jgi:hypothetical protein
MKILQLLLESRVDYLKDFYLKKYSDKFPTEDNPTILNLIDDFFNTQKRTILFPFKCFLNHNYPTKKVKKFRICFSKLSIGTIFVSVV